MRTVLFFVVCLFCVVFHHPTSATAADHIESPRMAGKSKFVIAAFGDSLIAGYGLSPEDSFPAQLKAKLQADGIQAQVINDGVSGDTTAGAKSRLPNVLIQKPDLVILAFGGNDILRGLPAQDAEVNLDYVMKNLYAAHIKIFMIGQKAPLSLGVTYSQAIKRLYQDLAKKYNAPLYPVYLSGVYGNGDLMQADGIHPNQAGVAAILEKLEPEILTEIKSQAPN